MFNRIRSRLTLLILGGAIISIILVSLIANITLFKKFDIYMRNEQENRLEEVIDLIKQAYDTKNNIWTKETLDNISRSPLINSFDIEIRDGENDLIFANYVADEMIQMHNEMMGRMGHSIIGSNHYGMMGSNNQDENYQIKEYNIFFNNQRVAAVTIGRIAPFLISEREIEFAKGINVSIFYGAVISIIVAIIIGMLSSRIFSKPIVLLTDAANSIREGNLDIEVEVPNKIVELQGLSRSINHLSRTLSKQELLRKRLTSDISHELRTPLTILLSHIEAISDGIWEPTHERLSLCKSEVVRLIKLVEELKHLTDIENHKLTLNIEEYSLSKDLKEILESFMYKFQEKKIAITEAIEEDVYFHGDRDKIKQSVINILSNALKYTDEGGRVDFSVKVDRDKIKIIIQDTGIGIDEKDIPYVFERFYRSDESRDRRTGGRGIGLAITKTIVEAHGGNVTVKSQKGKGTTFTIILFI